MPLQYEFFAVRLNDQEMLDAARSALEETGATTGNAKHESELIGSGKQGNITEINAIESIAAKNSYVLRRVKIDTGRQYLQVERTQGNDKRELFPNGDRVIIVHHHDDAISQHVDLVAAARKYFTSAERAERLPDNIDSMDDAIRERVVVLKRLEQLAETFFQKSAEHITAAESRLTESYARQEEKLAQRRDALEHEHATRMAELGQKEIDLDKRITEVDLRDPRIVRRKLREDLLRQLKDRKDSFELTLGTSLKFAAVVVAYALLIGGFITAIAYTESWHREADSDLKVALLVRESLLILGVALTGWFLVRAVHHWFRDHADEVLYARRLELDVNRASWVYEMAVEWQQEKQGPVPDVLIERLSRNVFHERAETTATATPLDAISSALKRDGSLSVRAGDKEIVIRQKRGRGRRNRQ